MIVSLKNLNLWVFLCFGEVKHKEGINMYIKQTDRFTVDGLPIVQIKHNGETKSYFCIEDKEELIEYDESINNISFSYEEEEDEDGTKKVFREETRKRLTLISKDRILGLHEYFKPSTGESFKAIVVWKKFKGLWRPSVQKGCSDMDNDDIMRLSACMKEMGW